MIYLDNNSTTPLHPSVKRKIIETLDMYGNASSKYEIGRCTRKQIEESREIISKFIKCNKNQILFTSCGSESNNFVIRNSLYLKPEFKIKHIITSIIEHPSIINTLKELEKEKKIEVTYIKVDEYGFVNPKDIENSIRENTVLISIMFANNEIGTIQPIKEIGSIAKKKNIWFHTDAVQAIGKIRININELNVDFLSASGHKIYAPKGIGFLYHKQDISKLKPLIYGGHQENGLRAGTENNIGIIAMGEAISILDKTMDDENKKISDLRDRLENGILNEIPYTILNGSKKNRVPGTTNISFEGVEGESILLHLDIKGIEVSTGSACSSNSLDPSTVIMALENRPERAHSSIRFSIGHNNTIEEIDYTIESLKEIISQLRKISTVKL